MTHNARFSTAVLAELQKRKKALHLASIDAVISRLLWPPPDDGDVEAMDGSNESSSDEEEDDPVAGRNRRRLDVREALYSLEILSERPGMIEFLTGFGLPAVNLLVRRFREVCAFSLFFSCRLSRPTAEPQTFAVAFLCVSLMP